MSTPHLYRQALRELKQATPKPILLKSRNPVIPHLRQLIVDDEKATTLPDFIHYVKHSRIHEELVARYNPGMNMSEKEKIELTARRVGLDASKFDNIRDSAPV